MTHENALLNIKITEPFCIDQYFGSEVRKLSKVPKTTLQCPDQWVGDVEWIGTGFKYLNTASHGFSRRQNIVIDDLSLPIKRLIVVLESPHTDEYILDRTSGTFTAVGPANGTTGVNLRNFIEAATREFSSSDLVKRHDTFALILMNAIPYQCSLGNPLGGPKNVANRIARDTLFRSCWNVYEQIFRLRLTSYCNEQSLVVNACTRGQRKVGGKWLRDLVEDAIGSCKVAEKHRIRRQHPSWSPNWKNAKSWTHTLDRDYFQFPIKINGAQ